LNERLHTHRPLRVDEARMLAMADRLFAEFDEKPVRTVLAAIGRARTELRDVGSSLPKPRVVEDIARHILRGEETHGEEGRSEGWGFD
jgi:hypothetical protein